MQAEEAISLARRKNLFLMEAMWTRFLPPIVKLRQMLADGLIGEVRMVAADLGFDLPWDPSSRLYDANLGGGCLLDVGIYPISLATMVLGVPTGISGKACIGSTGVDEQNAITLEFEGGRLASLYSSIRTETPQQACIIGTKGRVDLHSHWWRGGPMTVRTTGGAHYEVDVSIEGNGYQYEAKEVGDCLCGGKAQSDIMPWAESLTVMRTMDRLRALWGLKYPME